MEEPELRQDLRGWQIFFIVASVIIGEGIFSGDGQALAVSGPGGTLLALFIISIITICVMECISEFVQLYPCPNAIVAYIEAFVDEDLAWVCGIAYWYTFASIFAALNMTAANFTAFWNLPTLWFVIAFYIIAPIVLLGINLVGVGVFGMVESVGGILKITLVLGTGILMYVLSSRNQYQGVINPIYDAFEVNQSVAANPAAAVCWNLPVIAYSFIGHETVAVTAFEARTSRSLRLPSQSIAYFIFVLYIFTAVGEFLMVKWSDPHLPKRPDKRSVDNGSIGAVGYPNSTNMAIIAAAEAGLRTMPGFLNGCYIFSVLSASNSALYVASRTLYGLTRDLPRRFFVTRNLGKLSAVVHKTGVPAMALFVSVISFFWLPFLHIKKSYSAAVLLEVLQTTSSVSCLIVWAALCLAFIRYQYWLKQCGEDLQSGDYSHYPRDDKRYKAFTVLAFAQPLPAYVGFIGTLLIILVFTSSTWWHTKATFHKVALAYASPVVFLLMWLSFKLMRYRSHDFHWYVKIDGSFSPLLDRLDRLRWLKRDEREGNGLRQSVVSSAAEPNPSRRWRPRFRRDRKAEESDSAVVETVEMQQNVPHRSR